MLRRCRQSRWLWLTVVFLSVSIVTCADCTERHHHHHHHHHHYKHQHPHQDTRHSSQPELQLLSSSQLEKIPSLPSADMAEDPSASAASCPNCVLPEQKRDKAPLQQQSSDEIRLETIKRQILSKLGLKEKPIVTSPVPREVIMETLYRAEETGDQHDGSGSGSGIISQHVMYEDDSAVPSSTRPPESEPDDFYGRTSEIIAFAEPGHTLNGQTLVEFSHAQDLGGGGGGAGTELRVKAATLWVRVDFRSPLHRAFRHNVPDKNLTLWVFTVTQQLQMNATHLSGKEFDEYTEMAASLPVSLSTLGWQKFDLTTTVRAWYSSGAAAKERLRLLVDCSGCGDLVEAVLFRSTPPGAVDSPGGAENKDPQRPFLVVHTDPTATRRVRRRALDCSGALRGQCCKQRFFVSFKQLGWEDWIIAPSGYYANYCQGNCGGIHRTPDTFLNYYTHVIEEYRKLDRLTGMQPCCAPVKFSSMSLIYFGPDSNIIKRDLPKMVVDECGCP